MTAIERDSIVTVIGGSGFIGRYVVEKLAHRGCLVRVAVRRPERALFLKTSGDIGQITPLPVNIRDPRSIAAVIAGAQAVVSMGGYNTVCEILSFDKPALVVPRTVPREEQLIRASRASELGLFDMLLPEDAENPAKMAAALKALPNRAPPSVNARGLKLDGLENISRRIAEWLPSEGDKAPITLTA